MRNYAKIFHGVFMHLALFEGLSRVFYFPTQLLDFLIFESCIFPLLLRSGTKQQLASIIDSTLHMSLDVPYLILKEDGNTFQVLRNEEKAWLGVKRENFLELSWVKWLAHETHIPTPLLR